MCCVTAAEHLGGCEENRNRNGRFDSHGNMDSVTERPSKRVRSQSIKLLGHEGDCGWLSICVNEIKQDDNCDITQTLAFPDIVPLENI